MTSQVKMRITLEGGAEFRKELQSIVDSAKRLGDMASSAAKAGGVNSLRLAFQGLSAPINQSIAGVKGLNTAMLGVNTAITASVTNLKRMAFSAGIVTGAVAALIRSSIRLSNAYQQESAAAGLTVEEYGRIRYAMEQTEAPMENAAIMMSYLNKKIAQAAEGAGKGAVLFKELGINVKNAEGEIRPTVELLGEVADRMQELYGNGRTGAYVLKTTADGFEKLYGSARDYTAIANHAGIATRSLAEGLAETGSKAKLTRMAMDLFGRGGAKMLNFMSQGSKGIRELGDEAERLGIVLSTEGSSKLDDFKDGIQSLYVALQAFVNRGLIQLSGEFEATFKSWHKYFQENRKDIDAWLSSVLRGVIDAVPKVVRAIKAIVAGFAWMWETISAASAQLQPLFDIFNNMFGTDVSARMLLIIGLFARWAGVLGVVRAMALLAVKALGFLAFTPLGRVIALLGALWGLAKALAQGWGPFKDAILQAFGVAGNAVVGFMDELVKAYPGLGEFRDAAKAAFLWLQDNIPGALEFVKVSLLTLNEGLDWLVAKFNEFTGLTVDSTFMKIGAALFFVSGAARAVAASVLLLARGIGAMAIALLTSPVTWYFAAWGLAIATVVGLVYGLYQAISEGIAIIDEWWSGLSEGAQTAIGLIGTLGGAFIALGVTGWLGPLLGALASVAGKAGLGLIHAALVGIRGLMLWIFALGAANPIGMAIAAVALLAGGIALIVTHWEDVKAAIMGVVDWIIDAYKWVEKWIGKLLEAIGLKDESKSDSSSSSSSEDGQSFAKGGRVWGAGTGTSDSIPAWLSNGEFVVNAAAVREYGAGLLHQINSLSLPRFAEGGSVGVPNVSSMLRPVMGGVSGQPLTLNIDGTSFNLIAPADEVENLSNYASRKRRAANGRKPSWYGSRG